MRCANCQYENRQGVRFCEQCGAHLQTISIEKPTEFLCTSCGFNNTKGAKFCEQCGNPLEKRIVLPETTQQSETKSPREKSKFQKTVIRAAIVILILLFGLILLGLLPSSNELTPIISADPIPLLTLRGVPITGEAVAADAGTFSASASDEEGIERMELYSDGELIAAENYSGEPYTPVEFEPPLEALPKGEHDIMVVTTNTQGQTAQSQIVPVINIEPEPLPPEDGLVIEPDPLNLPAPEVITAILSDDRKTVIVGWSLPDVPIRESKVYLQPPGAMGLTLHASVENTISQYDFPANPTGLWHIYVAFVSLDGREGPMGHVHIVVPEPDAEGVVADENCKIIAADVSLDLITNTLQNGIYAYVRIGGDANRYQRLPPGQGEFYYRQVTGKFFNFEIPLSNWPISQPLMVEAELWALDQNQLPWRVGWYSHTFTTEEMVNGQMEYQSSEFIAQVELEFDSLCGVTGIDVVEGPKPKLLPPPTNLHLARNSADCQNVSSKLGEFRDALYSVCTINIFFGNRQILLWEWPLKQAGTFHATESDISGFELKYVETDEQDQVLGETVTAIPFPEARGYFVKERALGYFGTSGLDCGIRRSWYLRAIGPYEDSEWVFAGTIPPESCEAPEPEANGCGGQMDFLPDWNPFGDFVPDLIFESACNTHDKCYNSEWSGKSKVTCDNEFLTDMQAICNSKIPLIDPMTCYSVAQTYYEAVNLFGRFFYQGDMDVRDCLQAVNPTDCFLGHSPEFATNAWNAFKSGAVWTGKAFKTGVSKVGDGLEWTGNQIGDGLSKVGDFFGW